MTLWGSSAAFRNGLTGNEEWVRIDNVIKGLNGGYGMEVRRSYHGSIPSNISGTFAAQDVGKRVSAFSITPHVEGESANTGWNRTINGEHDAAIRSFVRSVPSGHKMYLIYNHEPENDGGSPATLWRQGWARFAKVVLDVGNSNVIPTFNLMAYTWWGNVRNPWDYNPARHMTAAEAAACLGTVDAYSQSPATLFNEAHGDVLEWGFRGFGCLEFGIENVANRGDWMLDVEDWVDTHANVELFCWWHSVAGAFDTFLDNNSNDPGSLGDWADIIARNQGAIVPVSTNPDVELPTGTPVVGSGATPGSSSNPLSSGVARLSQFAVAPSPDGGYGFVAGGRLYFSGPAGTMDAQGYVPGNCMWSAKIDFDTTVDFLDDRIAEIVYGSPHVFRMLPGGGGRPVLSDYKMYDHQKNTFWLDTYLLCTFDNIDGYLWHVNRIGGFMDGWLIENYKMDTGDRIAYGYHIEGGISGYYGHIFAISPTEALLVYIPHLSSGDRVQFVKCVVSGSGITTTQVGNYTIAAMESALPDSGTIPIFRYQRENGIGIMIFSNGHYITGEKIMDAMTWQYDGNTVTMGNPIAYTDIVTAAGGGDRKWIPEYYEYGNTKRLSDGTHVDIAYKDFDNQPHPWNIVFTFQWDLNSLEVLQVVELPLEAHVDRAEEFEHVIGWGSGNAVTTGRAIGFDDSSGVLQIFYDASFTNFGPTDISAYHHKLITDPFGAMDIQNLSTFGYLSAQWFPIDNTYAEINPGDTPIPMVSYADFSSGTFFFEEGYIGNTFNWILSSGWTATDGTVSPDAYGWSAPLPGGYEAMWAYNGPIIARVVGATPDLDGSLTEKRQKFARPPTDYTP